MKKCFILDNFFDDYYLNMQSYIGKGTFADVYLTKRKSDN